MKRALLLLAVTALWSETDLFAATITLTNKDPRKDDSNLVSRDWGARLRNFGVNGDGSEIYIGSGDLSFSENRKVADLIWNNTGSGINTFTLEYSPNSPTRIDMSASGSTSASQFYNFQAPVKNPNEPVNTVLIDMHSSEGDEEIRITNLVLTITGGATTNLGTIQVVEKGEIFALINDPDMYTSGFTLTGNVFYPEGFQGVSEERPGIEFFALFDRNQSAMSDLTLTKSHAGSFTQGQAGATYTVTARNIGTGPTSGTVTVVDNFPPSLIPTAAAGSGWACNISTNTATCTRSDVLAPGASYPPIIMTVTVASSAPAEAVNAAAVTGGSDGNSANNTVNDPTTIIRGPDVTIVKTASGSFTQGQTGAGYTLTVTNTGGVATGGIVSVIDNLPTGVFPATVSGPGWSCGISGNTATCTRSDSLAPGAGYPPITLTVNVANNAPPSVTNMATVGGGGDLNAANNTATVVTPIARAPDLTIMKSHTGNFTQGQTAIYTVTVTNTGAAATSGTVVVADPMSQPLAPGTGSGSGWSCDILAELIRCQRSDALAPGASYPPITMTASIAPNAPPTILNLATVSGGGDGNASNNSASDTATILPASDLTITKSHSGNFTQGQAGTYTLTVSNVGGSPTSGSATVVDELPAGLVPSAASGAGWSCSISGEGVSCGRSDPLAPGQSYPAITLTVNVQRNAPASVTNTAVVFGGGGVNPSNNTATDPTTITAGSNLTITKSHTGNFTQGQTGTYTLTVSNIADSPTSGTIVVADSLPSGLSSTGATGAGWSCAPGGQSVTCSRSDILNAGASYPPITLTVQVAPTAPPSLTNTATVAGGGDVDSSNNTASDPTTIIAAPDLTISKMHTGSFLQAQVGATYTLTAMNIGGSPTSSPVTINDFLPAGLTLTAAAGAGWVCNIAGQAMSCTRGDALNVGASYPAITLTVNVAPSAPPSLTNTATVSGGGEINTANSTAQDITTIGPGPDLTITKSHTGNFTQGQAGTYTLTVSNVGGAPTSASVSVIDTLPAALVPATAGGTGWTCQISGPGVSCARSDPLAPGQSYPAITLMVSVERNAPASVTNTAVVFGGGGVNLSNNTATDPTTITAGPDLTMTKSHTGNFTQGQAGTFTLTVSNTGGFPTSGTVVVTDSLPSGLSSTGATGAGWSCAPGGQSVTCSRSDILNAAASYPPITLTVQVAVNAPASVTNTATVTGGGGVDSSNNSASDPTTIIAVPDLTITKMHTGSFLQGQVGATYILTTMNIGGGPTSSPVTITDPLPAGLTPTAAAGAGWVCNIAGQAVSCTRSDALNVGATYPAITLTVNVAPAAPPSLTNTATVSGGGEINTANSMAQNITTIGSGPDLIIDKSHTGNFLQGQTGATYTITVSNSGSPLTAGVTATDNVPAGLLPISAAGAGWTCNISGQDVTCTRSDPLATGQSYPPITLTVNVQPNAPGSVTNTATVSGGGDVNPANNSDADVTAIIPGADLTITKSHTGNFTQGQTGASYTVTVTNSGVGPTTTMATVTDTLPLGLAPTTAVGVGWSCSVGALAVVCSRSDPLAPGASYPPITLTVQVAANAPASVTNTAMVAGGGGVDSSNNSASDPTTIIAVPDLTLTKTHTGSFLQGQVGATYTLTAMNIAGGPTSSPVTITDTLPAGLTPTAAAGAGWVCNIAGQAVSCTRSDALNAGASYPAITLTVNVAPAAPPSLTNTATVSGGGEINTANSMAQDTTTIGPGPDLTITRSHTGNLSQGQTGVIYTITVSNPGSPPTTGVVTVTEEVQAELKPTAASGVGWACSIFNQTTTCTRSDSLASGQSYPPITLTVSVLPGVPLRSVTSTATVSGGGDVNPANNSATDVTTIVPGADLTITKSHTGNFAQGQTGATYTVTVTNSGVGPTTTPVTVTDSLPLGLIPTAAAGDGWSCTVPAPAVVCTRNDPLQVGVIYPPITITVNVAPDAPATVTNTVAVSGGGGSSSANNTASDATIIMAGADLTVTKTHTGNFTQGQRGAAYTITVANSGGVPTSGPVTVIDLLPTGLSPSAVSGTGWTCDIIGQAVDCVRSDPLSPGGSYPPITVTVDTASDAPATVTNSARVTGGGDINPANNAVEDVTTITPGPDLTITKTHTGNFTQGQTGATYTVTVSNQGAAPTSRAVIVNDAMKLPFLPTAASGTGWTCQVLADSVQCQRSDALAAGAAYPPLTITVNMASNAAASVTNTVEVFGGGDVNAANNTASDPTTIVPGPDLTVTKTHTAIVTQGQRGATPALDYTLTVRNIGASPTTGTVTLIDSVPPGLIPVTAVGTGWTCTLSLQAVTCTRDDALAAGASYPPITLAVDVESQAPASVTNTATIAGGGDVNTSNNTATDPTLISRGQDLTISKSHTGSFTQGQRGATYTITVANSGAAPTIGTITLIDTVPTGLFPTAATGTVWTCTVSGETVNCTRGDPLGGGAGYEPVTVTVDVANKAPASVTNSVIVAGGGDVLATNNVADDVTAVTTGPDLTITKTHPNSFGPGQTGVIFILTVTNRGGSPTEGRVDVVDDLPVGLTAKTASGGGWTCEVSDDTVACSRTDALAPGASYPVITLTADVAPNLVVGSTLTNTARVSRGGDVNLGNNTVEDSEVLGLRPDLRISKTHSGNFTQGQTGATYTLTVSNAGQEATSGEVKVQDRLPTGLTPTSATGSGWTCTISGQTVTCTRSDALAPRGSYPPITLAVTVAPDAPASVTNTATVSGGGDDGSDTASDATTIEGGGPYTFAHVPVGGGYTTDFLISNTGASGAATELILTDQAGNPFPVLLVDPSTGATLATGSTFPVSIAAAGTSIFRAAPVNSADPVKIGWGRLVPSVDHVGGVASFDYLQQAILQSTAGVFGGYPINMATMPVDNDDTQNRFTGFAVANPLTENVNVTLYVLDENGGITDVLSPPELNPLGPLKQTAKFLHQYVPTKLKFKGSMVLVGQNGKTFAVVALVQTQGLVTVIPVIPSKAPQVP